VGQAVSVDTPIPEGFLGYNSEIKKYDYNQERALELLTKAGFTKLDEEGKRWKDGLRLEIAITSLDQPPFNQITEIIKQNWESIGAVVHVNLYDPVELQIDYVKPRNYETLLFGESMMHDPDPWPFWHSSGRLDPGLNLTSFKDETVDELLDSARKTLNQDERAKKYLHFQNILAEEVPAIFLYSPTYLYGVDKNIKGINLNRITFSSDRFAEINKWYVKTRKAWKK
jgi:peptide/nickel transport system substrate-binding protein